MINPSGGLRSTRTRRTLRKGSVRYVAAGLVFPGCVAGWATGKAGGFTCLSAEAAVRTDELAHHGAND